jgi:hypothetical protein
MYEGLLGAARWILQNRYVLSIFTQYDEQTKGAYVRP